MLLERRRADRDRRCLGRVSAIFAVQNTVDRTVQLGQAEDIAPTGMTLRRPRDIPVEPRTPVSLTFDLPGAGVRISASGFVVSDHRRGLFRRTGVRFERIEPEHAALLAEFCAARGWDLPSPRG